MRFICLANSYKEGGRCLAGIELDVNGNPVKKYGRPNWIRPIGNGPHGELRSRTVEKINLLEVVEINVTGQRPQGYQSENVSFIENSLRVVGRMDRDRLERFCTEANDVFGSRDKFITRETIGDLDHSLMLISTDRFQYKSVVPPDRPDLAKPRFVFQFRQTQYDLPLTDPAFLEVHNKNPKCLDNVPQLYLSLSISIEWKQRFYKLVAAVI